MKSPRSRFLLLACLLAGILALFLIGRQPPATNSPDSKIDHPQSIANIDSIQLPSNPNPSDFPPPEPTDDTIPEQPKVLVKRIISEEWIDSPEKLAGRQRVRIVEADFKYPYLRLEEAVTTDPTTGLETVTLLRASVADHVILGLKPDADLKLAQIELNKLGYNIRAIEPDSYILAELPMFDSAQDQTQATTDLSSLEEFIDHAEPDYLVFTCATPNDPAYAQGKMWGLHNPGTSADSTPDADIDAPEAWAIRREAPAIIVAVTDTGIQYDHEDLAANMWSDVAGSHGFDAYDNDNDPMDTGGHGTHCAGTIGASGNNNMGLTGVAWDVKLMAVRFLGPNGGTTSDSIRSVNYSRQNGAHIISASWGGGGYSQSLYNAIKACGDAGIPFVAAAGNSSANNDSTPHYPSSYNLKNIVAVASTTKKDILSTFSCYGRTSVDIAAPGSAIWSTYIGNTYTFLNGTSMATPHVSGALALAMAQFPSEEMESIIARLYASVDKIPALSGKVSTGGRLNLARLLGGSPPNISNDDFADAHRFEGDYGTWIGTNAGATREPDEDSFCIPGIGNKSLWIAFRTPHTGLVSLDVFSDNLGYEVVVFEGSVKGQLKTISHSNTLGGLNRNIRFTSKPDTEYRLVLDSHLTNTHRFLVDYKLAPPNDFFAQATPLAGDFFTTSGHNRAATNELFEKNKPHAGTGQGKSVWWKWTAPEDGDFIINTSGSAFDTVLAVYSGSSVYNLIEVASNDDRSPLDWTSQVTIPATAGTTYHIAVDSFREDAQGEIQLNGFKSGLLQIIRQPQSLSVELGKRAVFDVSILSGGEVSYQWFLNDKAIPGQTSANIVIDPVRTDDFGNYKVEVWNTENLVTSDTVTLSEKQTAPKLTWSSGNQAVATGSPVTLSANFDGSSPITYTWTKNGNPFPGDTTSLSFPSAQVTDSEAYRLTATNPSGSASTDFSLTVVDSPWERWEWRRPGVPNAPISDIKVHQNEAFALSGNAILRSTNGETWQKSLFPQNFTARSLAINSGLFVCLGHDLDKNLKFATSPDGNTWAVHNPVGFSGTGVSNPTDFKLSSFKNQFLATGLTGQSILRSSDGISWTPIQAQNINGQTINLTATGSPATDGNVLIVVTYSNSFDGSIRYFKTNDAISWQEHKFIPTSASTSAVFPASAAYVLGKFYLFGTYTIHSSTDAENWLLSSAPSSALLNTSVFAQAGNTAFAFQVGPGSNQRFYYFTNLSDRKTKTTVPASSQNFTAAATFGEKLIFGTDKGLLKVASDLSGITIPPERASTLASLEFVNDLFIARSETSYGSLFPPNLHSGDGVTWKTAHPLDVPETVYVGEANGKYWGRSTSYNASPVHWGYNPFDVRPAEGTEPGLGSNLIYIDEAADGSALAISSPDAYSSAYQLHRRANSANPWANITYPVSIGSDLRFTSIDSRWLSYSTQGSQSKLIHTSTNGTTWTSTGITGSNAMFIKHAGAIYCYFQSGSFTTLKMRKSSNGGSTWAAEQIATGVPATGQSVFAKRIVSFGDYIVLLGNNQRLYFSQNGSTWIEGFTPSPIIEIASAKGKLIAISTNGGVLETGSIHPGKNAPLVNIRSPQPTSNHLLNSQIIVEGVISDPEEGSASFQAFIDGNLIASGTGTNFRFPITTTSIDGHTITVYATDSHGLKQLDSIRLKIVLPEPDNLLRSPEGKTFVPTQHATVLDGVFYVAAARSLYRSLDGIAWERVSIPGLANPIYGMAAGNGSLVVQFDNGGVITTRDGINWTVFQPNQTNYWVRTPIQFTNGVFIAAYQNQGTTSGSVMTSSDGLIWTTGTTSEDGFLNWVARHSNGTIIGYRGYGGGVVRSTDSGSNWQMINEFPTSGPQALRGFFANGKFVLHFPNNGKILTSENSYDWQDIPPPDVGSGASLTLEGDTFFLADSFAIRYASKDGSSWLPVSHPIRPSPINFSRGTFLATSGEHFVRSADGIQWTILETPFSTNSITKIMGNENVHIVIDNKGATWVSPDTHTWTPHLPGTTLTSFDGRVGQEIVELGGVLIAGGSVFAVSEDDGLSWSSPKLYGSPINSISLARIAANETAVIAATTYQNFVFHSTDGINYIHIPSLPNKAWADIAWNGSQWMILAKDGSLFRSLDNGLSWQAVFEASSLRKGASITWYNSKWVIVGSDSTAFNAAYTCFNLTAGNVFTKHGTIGFYNSNSDVRTLLAHGKLLVWERGEEAFVSTDGTSWTKSDLTAGAGNHDYDVYHTPDGFVAFIGSTVSYYPVVAWKSGPDGLNWIKMPAPFNNITNAHNLDDRLFVFTGGLIAEIHAYDLAVKLPSLQPVTIGVGDTIRPTISITNHGISIPPGGRWAVKAWLSRTRFFGDGKDISIGTFEIDQTMPTSGTQKSIELEFVLPNEIPTGNNHLILSLVNLDGLREKNTPNNTVISDTAAINIPEWEFSVATNGNGAVNRDFAAARYPHKAQVSLTANAGKGATFTGWGGDAFSPNNQITILMDGDKSIQANFSNRATLQVFVNGVGEVTGLSDMGSYPVGDIAEITATPSPGWEFSHWSGASEADTPAASIPMDSPKTATAHFVLPMATWKNSSFTPQQLADTTISADHLDPDNDGVPTWKEYLHGSHPMDKNSTGATPITIENGYLRCVYTRNVGAADGASLTCQAGNSLSNWDSPDLEERILSTIDGIQTVEARIPITGKNMGFIRFRYDPAQP